MSETITLEPGAKVRQSGTTYKVVDTATIEGELIEVKAQKNRHKLAWCASLVCQDEQKRINRGKLFSHGRASNSGAWDAHGFPQCGQCGRPWEWKKSDEGEPTTE